MHRSILPTFVALAVLGLGACGDDVPTGLDPDLFPVTPQSVELRLPWSSFAESLEVIGGFGSPTELFHGVVANDFEGVLDARTLARFNPFPDTAFVQIEGANQRTALTYVGGRLVARFDTLASTNEGPVTIVANAVDAEWHPSTTTWTVAVDTINDRRLWPVPGGGPAREVGSGVWDPEEGDSVSIGLDSATVAALGDTTDATRGLRLDVLEAGVRLQTTTIFLRLDAVPELKQDTVVVQSAGPEDITFIYDPVPEPPPDGIRIGGVPAWRTVLEVGVPAVIEEPSPVCAQVTCPFVLEPDRINAASLLLHSRATPPAFQPTDTVRLDVRPVLFPSRLPKAPLGQSVVGAPGRPVPPEAFGEGAGQQVAIPVTSFVRDLVRGETREGDEPPNTLALLSFFEPLSISFASFEGPGGEIEPTLRLIVTLSDTVEVR